MRKAQGMTASSLRIPRRSSSKACFSVFVFWILLIPLVGFSADVKSGGPPPVTVEMKLGKNMRLDFKREPEGGANTALLCDAGGVLWVFHAPFEGPLYFSRFVNGIATPLETAVSGWKFINRIAGSLDADGNPTVIWSGIRSDQDVAAQPLKLGERNRAGNGLREGQVLAASTWTGEAWTSATILDVLGTGMVANRLHSIRDTRGSVHVVYDRQLEPPESYSRGFIVVDGFFANKCFHVHSERGNCSLPLPTTGKGRFSVQDMRLTNTPDGPVALSMLIRPPRKAYVGVQTWDGKSWSSLKQVSPDLLGPYTYEGGSFQDKWGTRITWWNSELQYTFVASDPEGKDRTQQFTSAHTPIFEFHTSGAVLLLCPNYGGGDLRAWDGKRWTEPMACSHGQYLAGSASGVFYVAGREGAQLVAQEVILQVCAGTTSQRGRRGE